MALRLFASGALLLAMAGSGKDEGSTETAAMRSNRTCAGVCRRCLQSSVEGQRLDLHATFYALTDKSTSPLGLDDLVSNRHDSTSTLALRKERRARELWVGVQLGAGTGWKLQW